MRLKVILICFLFNSLLSTGQVKGYLFPSLEVKGNATLSFFLVAEIDTLKSFEENLKSICCDTLKRISIVNLSIDEKLYTKNVGGGKIISIIPMEVVFGDWVMYDMYLNKKAFIPFPLTILGRKIIDGYDANSIRSFTRVRILRLPDEH